MAGDPRSSSTGRSLLGLIHPALDHVEAALEQVLRGTGPLVVLAQGPSGGCGARVSPGPPRLKAQWGQRSLFQDGAPHGPCPRRCFLTPWWLAH